MRQWARLVYVCCVCTVAGATGLAAGVFVGALVWVLTLHLFAAHLLGFLVGMATIEATALALWE